MAREVHGMVEKRGAGLWLTHLIMIAGVLVIFFPIWLAFVASTVTQAEIIRPPMPVWPGDQFLTNYRNALVSGMNVPVATMLLNSLIMAVGIAVGKIVISLLSAFWSPASCLWFLPPVSSGLWPLASVLWHFTSGF